MVVILLLERLSCSYYFIYTGCVICHVSNNKDVIIVTWILLSYIRICSAYFCFYLNVTEVLQRPIFIHVYITVIQVVFNIPIFRDFSILLRLWWELFLYVINFSDFIFLTHSEHCNFLHQDIVDPTTKPGFCGLFSDLCKLRVMWNVLAKTRQHL